MGKREGGERRGGEGPTYKGREGREGVYL